MKTLQPSQEIQAAVGGSIFCGQQSIQRAVGSRCSWGHTNTSQQPDTPTIGTPTQLHPYPDTSSSVDGRLGSGRDRGLGGKRRPWVVHRPCPAVARGRTRCRDKVSGLECRDEIIQLCLLAGSRTTDTLALARGDGGGLGPCTLHTVLGLALNEQEGERGCKRDEWVRV